MQCYVGDPGSTASALNDGWLHTGDRGRIDSSGFLYITGRIKEAMVSSSGETIYPDEVEPYFASPLFAELAVVPAAGEDGNDWPALVVVPADPATSTLVLRRAAASLNAAAPARLRVSGVIVRTEPLPRTAAGKIKRRELATTITTAGVAS
jgi:acyl-CoA synthetase (AMP-forming)/AMP-acid ligase II